jgi:two-component system phosphate regulon response regulator PhoB
MAVILIVDDEADMLCLLDLNLRLAGHETLLAANSEQVLRILNSRTPDLVLLDVMLPDVPGTEICRNLRADPRTANVPVILCSARSTEADRVAGLEAGADDYVTKPFSMRELILRVRAVLLRSRARRQGEPFPSVAGTVRVDVAAHRAFVGDRELALTPVEFRLLLVLLSPPGRARSREELLQTVWNTGGETSRTIDTHVRRLREKLGAASACLQTVRGVGYRVSSSGGEAPAEPEEGGADGASHRDAS